jgi:hypothetical protein
MSMFRQPKPTPNPTIVSLKRKIAGLKGWNAQRERLIHAQRRDLHNQRLEFEELLSNYDELRDAVNAYVAVLDVPQGANDYGDQRERHAQVRLQKMRELAS